MTAAEHKHGYPSLGNMNKFLRRCIGDDALLEVEKALMQDGKTPYREDSSIKKDWDRFCSEDSDIYSRYRIDSDAGLLHDVKLFLDNMIESFDLDVFIGTTVSEFYRSYMDLLSHHPAAEDPINVPDVDTEGIILRMLYNSFRNLIYRFYKVNIKTVVTIRNNGYFTDSFTLKKFLSSMDKTADEICSELEAAANKDFNENAFRIFSEKTEECINSDRLTWSRMRSSYADILDEDKDLDKDVQKNFNLLVSMYAGDGECNRKELMMRMFRIVSCCLVEKSRCGYRSIIDGSRIPSWQEAHIIYGWLSSEDDRSCFISIYFFERFWNSLKNTFGIDEDGISEVKGCLTSFLETGEDAELPFPHFYSEESSAFSEGLMYIFKIPYDGLKDRYERMKEEFPQILRESNRTMDGLEFMDFFDPWIEGYIKVLERRTGEAVKLYKKAFENRYLAGDYLEFFLKQAFVLELYCSGSWNKATLAAREDTNNRNPVPAQAKCYWDYGYALGFFPKSADDTYLEAFRMYREFYHEFNPEFFEHPQNSMKIAQEEIMNEMGLFLDGTEPSAKKLDRFYDCICDWEDGTRFLNDLMRHPSAPTDSRTEKRLYTPFSLCLAFGKTDSRFLDIAEKWIDYPNLQTAKKNFNNSTALLEAISAYKHIRFAEKKDEIKEKRYKTLILKLIEKYDAKDFCETKVHKIHTLEEAINSYDIDIVKAMVGRGIDINSLIISADRLSPLYYAVMRKDQVNKGPEGMKERIDRDPYNVNPGNLDIPGMTASEKINYKITDTVMFSQDIFRLSYRLIFGEEKIRGRQIEGLSRIIDFLLEKTDDPDEFESVFFNGSHCNTLCMAAEADDTETCTRLIARGADCLRNLGYINLNFLEYEDDDGTMIPVYSKNNFIYRLINFQSWNTLKIFLEKYPDLARKALKSDESYFMVIPPLPFFLKCISGNPKKDELQKTFLPLFIRNGAEIPEDFMKDYRNS